MLYLYIYLYPCLLYSLLRPPPPSSLLSVQPFQSLPTFSPIHISRTTLARTNGFIPCTQPNRFTYLHFWVFDLLPFFLSLFILGVGVHHTSKRAHPCITSGVHGLTNFGGKGRDTRARLCFCDIPIPYVLLFRRGGEKQILSLSLFSFTFPEVDNLVDQRGDHHYHKLDLDDLFAFALA